MGPTMRHYGHCKLQLKGKSRQAIHTLVFRRLRNARALHVRMPKWLQASNTTFPPPMPTRLRYNQRIFADTPSHTCHLFKRVWPIDLIGWCPFYFYKLNTVVYSWTNYHKGRPVSMISAFQCLPFELDPKLSFKSLILIQTLLTHGLTLWEIIWGNYSPTHSSHENHVFKSVTGDFLRWVSPLE